MPSTAPQLVANRWPHRLAVALALTTFPLLWVGGLVTTYQAGMAVPDWPNTYGWNLFLYPLSTWIAGPWDLFIEHGHRLLGSLAGMLSIALLVVVWRKESPRWLKRAAAGVLALVCLQGVLGGLRVLLDARTVALVHACIGPLFFAATLLLAQLTAPSWSGRHPLAAADGRRFAAAAWLTAGLAYVQIIFGALLRHLPIDAPPGLFRSALILHLVLAGVLLFQVSLLAVMAQVGLRKLARCNQGWLRWPAEGLLLLVVWQISLGLATYVVKYAFPAWMDSFQFAAGYVVQEKSLVKSVVTTLHVASGALLFAGTTVLALRASRLFFRSTASSFVWPACTLRAAT